MKRPQYVVLGMIGLLLSTGSVQALEEQAQPIASELLAPGSSHPALAPSPAPASAPSSSEAASATIVRPTSQTVSTVGEALGLCDTFMQQIVQGRYSAAFAAFWPYFPITPAKQEQLYEATSQQLVGVEAQFGRSLGYVFLDTKTLSDTVLRCRFFQRFELEVVVWEFDFYNAGNGWQLNAIAFDGSMEHLFE
jgi:hypothetical protein